MSVNFFLSYHQVPLSSRTFNTDKQNNKEIKKVKIKRIAFHNVFVYEIKFIGKCQGVIQS